MKTLSLLMLVAMCAACGPFSNETDACGARGYRALVGTDLAAVTIPSDLEARIIQPGDLVTQEYRPGRLNIRVVESGRILSVRCG